MKFFTVSLEDVLENHPTYKVINGVGWLFMGSRKIPAGVKGTDVLVGSMILSNAPRMEKFSILPLDINMQGDVYEDRRNRKEPFLHCCRYFYRCRCFHRYQRPCLSKEELLLPLEQPLFGWKNHGEQGIMHSIRHVLA